MQPPFQIQRDKPRSPQPQHRPVVPLVPLPPTPLIKGRGSTRAVAHRFEVWQREPVDDGWAAEPGDTDAADTPPKPATEVSETLCKSALNRNTSPDLGFTHSVNPYRGCEHGCSYCYARPGHSYLNLSPGLDFETRLIAKTNIVDVLRRELTAAAYRPGKLVLGGVTDVYQPIERHYRLSRGLLELLHELRHPVALVTKGSLIERDLDVLSDMSRWQGVAVYITITTLDAELARKLEPRAASPAKRLQLIARLVGAGIRVGVSLSPQIPFLNVDMEACLSAARQAGARSAFYSVLRLPHELDAVFQAWLHTHYPDRAERVMNRVRDLHGGHNYRSDFGLRHSGQGPWAELLAQRFAKACLRLGYARESEPLNNALFQGRTASPPHPAHPASVQPQQGELDF